MDQQDRVPSLSPTEAEAFWRMGQDARIAATDPDQDSGNSEKLEAEPATASAAAAPLCCVGTDVPGVGYVHSAECPHATPPAHSRRGDAGGELPRPLRGLLAAEPLLIRLIFAANIMAGKRIFSTPGIAMCFECSVVASTHGVIQHAAGCSVGEVAQILAALETLNSQPGKEAAADVGMGRAGDGIRPREADEKERLDALTLDLGAIVGRVNASSALLALEMTAIAFGHLLDLYAAPNPENPLGMCDDRVAFRGHFAELVAEGGAL